MRRISFLVLAVILLLSACFFSMNGSGEYEYQFESDETDSLEIPEIPPIPEDSTDESIDDDFDLLYGDTPEGIKGRYGGGVFRNWKGKTVLGALPNAVSNPSTASQEKSRGLLSNASKIWGKLSSTIRDEWRAVASTLSEEWDGFGNPVGARSIIYPPSGPYTGLGAVTSVIGLLGSVDDWEEGDATPDAPVGVTGPSAPLIGTLSGDTTAGLTVPWTDPSQWGANGTAGWVRVFVKSEDGAFHAQLADSETATTKTATITTLRPRGGGAAISLTEGYYTVQLDAVNAEGMRSAPSAIAEFKLEAAV